MEMLYILSVPLILMGLALVSHHSVLAKLVTLFVPYSELASATIGYSVLLCVLSFSKSGKFDLAQWKAPCLNETII